MNAQVSLQGWNVILQYNSLQGRQPKVLPGSFFGFLRHYPWEVKQNNSKSIIKVNGIQITITFKIFNLLYISQFYNSTHQMKPHHYKEKEKSKILELWGSFCHSKFQWLLLESNFTANHSVRKV
jgi:hypothetical protein